MSPTTLLSVPVQFMSLTGEQTHIVPDFPLTER